MFIRVVLKIQKKKFHHKVAKTQSIYYHLFIFFFFAPEFIPRSLAGCLSGEKNLIFGTAHYFKHVHMKLIIIVAHDKERAIGKGGTLPWHISEDLKRFKQLTTGHTILMGRKTFESLGRPLPNRRNVVVTSSTDREKFPEGVEVYSTIDSALDALHNEEKVFVIGGGLMYAQLISRADELLVTLVDQHVERADTFFPPYEHLLGTIFHLVNEEKREGYSFLDYMKKNT